MPKGRSATSTITGCSRRCRAAAASISSWISNSSRASYNASSSCCSTRRCVAWWVLSKSARSSFTAMPRPTRSASRRCNGAHSGPPAPSLDSTGRHAGGTPALLKLFRREGRLLLGEQPFDHAAHVHPVGVGGDVDEAAFAELAEPGLLRLDHRLVLEKGRGDLAIELLGRLRLVLAIAVRSRPEITAAGLGFRAQAVEQGELEAEIALRIGILAAGIGRAGPLQDAARRDKLEFLKAVDP